jgi:hypothetical protein
MKLIQLLRGQLHTIILVGALLLAISISWKACVLKDASPKRDKPNQNTASVSDRREGMYHEAQTRLGRRVSSPATQRARDLLTLKARWRELGRLRKSKMDSNAYAAEAKVLAQESAVALSTSPESLRLLALLEQEGMTSEAVHVRSRILAMFGDQQNAEILQLMVSTVNALYHSGSDSMRNDLMKWSHEAGRTATKDELELLIASIGEQSCRDSLRLGRYLALSAEAPEEAFMGTVSILESGTESLHRSNALEKVIEKFPRGALLDYRSLESSLPPDINSNTDAYNRARTVLLVKWAKEDPASVANHVMENPEAISPERIRTVVSSVIHSEADGIEWAKHFPEGVYFDYAAAAVVSRLAGTDPDQAWEWAEKISDDEIRKDRMDHIKSITQRRQKKEDTH